MRAFFSILGLGAWVASAQAYTFDDTGASDALAAQALQNFMTYQYDNASNAAASCPQDQIIRRREWNSLSVEEREAYVQANVCMFTSPNKGTVAPGARTRWDDFCVTHQQQALYIHNVGNFFAWHRWYIIAWETALRDECGYTGYLPYLDWAKIASDPIGAPIFDGSNSSISSNGVYLQHNENLGQVPGNPLVFPTGSGGGCVEDGPFANRTINLGPRDALDYNPRCMSRDILQVVSSEAMTDAKTAQVINDNDNIVDFQNNFQFVGAQGDFANWGIHASGHNMISGTPGGDFWISAAEPWFYLYHANIDRIWWTWQNQDPANRMFAVGGPRANFGQPADGNTELSDTLHLGTYNLFDRNISSVMSTVEQGLCYVYE